VAAMRDGRGEGRRRSGEVATERDGGRRVAGGWPGVGVRRGCVRAKGARGGGRCRAKREISSNNEYSC
jgi:hypothetical protein